MLDNFCHIFHDARTLECKIQSDSCEIHSYLASHNLKNTHEKLPHTTDVPLVASYYKYIYVLNITQKTRTNIHCAITTLIITLGELLKISELNPTPAAAAITG